MHCGSLLVVAGVLQFLALGADVDPAKTLTEAREHRYTWGSDFTGFSAAVAVQQNEVRANGTIRVDKEGKVQLELSGGNEQLRSDAERQLRSLVQHHLSRSSRHGSGNESPSARFLDQDGHAAGRLIQVEGDRHSSTYRVKDGVLRVVNRDMGDRKMTITVLDTMATDAGKHLVTVYNVSNWSSDGALSTSSTVKSKWNKAGHLYLPGAIEEVEADKNGWKVTTYAFSNYKMSE